MIIKNNIKALLEERGISIRQLSRDLDLAYKFAHTVVNRDDLGTTQLSTLIKIANYLNVKVDDLFTNN